MRPALDQAEISEDFARISRVEPRIDPFEDSERHRGQPTHDEQQADEGLWNAYQDRPPYAARG